MATKRDIARPLDSRTPVLTWTLYGLLGLGLVVIPILVLGIGTYGWGAGLGISRLEFGLLASLPGVVLGVASLLVMLGAG